MIQLVFCLTRRPHLTREAFLHRWLDVHGIDPTQKEWKMLVQELPPDLMVEYHDRFTTRWHEALDAGHGACVLSQPEIADIVANSLLHFDGDRYEMLDFVIMPNHVHLLATFPDKAAMVEQCGSWKHFTARQINRRLDTQDRFWQQDAFDHLVRHKGQFHSRSGEVNSQMVYCHGHGGNP